MLGVLGCAGAWIGHDWRKVPDRLENLVLLVEPSFEHEADFVVSIFRREVERIGFLEPS